MLAQNFPVCGNLFYKIFALRDFNREENFLSSSRVVNAARVVQNIASRGFSAMSNQYIPRVVLRDSPERNFLHCAGS